MNGSERNLGPRNALGSHLRPCTAFVAFLAVAACDGGRSDSDVISPPLNQAPWCDAGPDRDLPCPGPVTTFQLDGSGSFDPEGVPLVFEWSTDCAGATFDDDTSATPVLSVPTPACALSCRVYLSVSDGFAKASDEAQILVHPDLPPVCDAGGDRNVACAGAVTPILLDGSASYDPEGAPLGFLWTTDCPGGLFDDPSSAMPLLSVPTPGCMLECRVYLTVSDGGQFSSCSALVRVASTGGLPDLAGGSGSSRAGRHPRLPRAAEPLDESGDAWLTAIRVLLGKHATASLDVRPRALELRVVGNGRARAQGPGALRILARSLDADPVTYFEGTVLRGESFAIDAARAGELTLRARIEIEIAGPLGALPRGFSFDPAHLHRLRIAAGAAGLQVTEVLER